MENNNTKKFKLITIILLILAVILLIFLSIRLFPLFANLGTEERST